MRRVAIYARVSTDEQMTANQLEELKRWAKNAGHAVGKPSRFYEFTPYSSRAGGADLTLPT